MQTNGGGEVSTAQMFVFENSLGVRDINKKLKDCPTLIEILHLIHLYSHQFNAVNCSTSFYAIGNFAMNQNDSFLSFVRNDCRFQLLMKKFLIKLPCATTWSIANAMWCLGILKSDNETAIDKILNHTNGRLFKFNSKEVCQLVRALVKINYDNQRMISKILLSVMKYFEKFASKFNDLGLFHLSGRLIQIIPQELTIDSN